MNLLKFSGSQMRENPFSFMTPKITLQNVLHCQFSSLHGFLQGKGLTVITILTLLLHKENPLQRRLSLGAYNIKFTVPVAILKKQWRQKRIDQENTRSKIKR